MKDTEQWRSMFCLWPVVDLFFVRSPGTYISETGQSSCFLRRMERGETTDFLDNTTAIERDQLLLFSRLGG